MANQPLDEKQLQALLRIKRFEQPPPGYFDDLLTRVHKRQREELLRRPAWQIAFDRVKAFFGPMHFDLAHAAQMAALLVAGVFAIRVALPDRASSPAQIASTIASAQHSVTNGPALTLQPASAPQLAVYTAPHVQRGNGGPTRFVIDTQPASYETTQIRF